MAKVVYLCSRSGAGLPFSRGDMEAVLGRLAPDHIAPLPPRIIEREGFLVGIFNPTDSLRVQDHAVCMGVLLERSEGWSQAGSPAPDGSYVVFRDDGETVEVLTDVVGTRTVWYAQTPDWFIASTSQRAIVCFLQAYEPNCEAHAWMLSSGTLGPGLSWDRRIRCLGGDARLVLNRETWTLTVSRETVRYETQDFPEPEQAERLKSALIETFRNLNLDLDHWVLPLSGGVDSRAVLLMLKDRSGLRTVTWGRADAIHDAKSDASVAQQLAARVGVGHEYFPIDPAAETFDQVLNRYLVAGEGRVDHLSAYIDGLAIWKHLYETGCQGVVRGDEAFGCMPARSPLDVYRNMELTTIDDYKTAGSVERYCREHGQRRPESLERRPDESFDAWRDRVNAEFEAPFIFAALNDLKLAYVEICSPLLSRRLMRVVRQLPDSSRTNKSLFRKIVATMGPDVRLARRTAIATRTEILTNPKITQAVTQLLRNAGSAAGLPRMVVEGILDAMAVETARPAAFFKARSRLRAIVGRLIRGRIKPRLDTHVLAFRACVIARMTEILEQDAISLRGGSKTGTTQNVASNGLGAV